MVIFGTPVEIRDLIKRLGQHSKDPLVEQEIDNLIRWINKNPLTQVGYQEAEATLTELDAGPHYGDTTGGAFITYLPTAVGHLGLTFIFKYYDGAAAWTIATNGAESLDGALSVDLEDVNDCIIVRSDNVNWYIVASMFKKAHFDGGTIENATITNSTVDNSTSPTSGLFVPTGVMLPFGGTVAPAGYLMCNGASLLRAGTYAALFAVIGTAYGAADGTHFNVPDFRGRFLRGVDHAVGRDPDRATRTAMATGGNTGDNVGSVQAAATARPTTAFSTSDSGTHTHSQKGYMYKITAGSVTYYSSESITDSTTTGAGGAHTHTIIGGGDAETRPLNAYVEYIIKF